GTDHRVQLQRCFEQPGDTFNDGQPQPGALARPDPVAMQLVEFPEYVIETLAGNAQAGVPHLDGQQITPTPTADQYPPRGRIANGIAEQIAHDSAEHAVVS